MRHGHAQEARHLGTAATLTKHRHAVGITAKVCNIFFHPAQGSYDIYVSYVAGVSVFLTVVREIGVPERIEPMVDRHDDHISFGSKVVSVVARMILPAAFHKASAMQPHEHGPLS